MQHLESLTLLHSKRPKLYGSFGYSECNRVKAETFKDKLGLVEGTGKFAHHRNVCQQLHVEVSSS